MKIQRIQEMETYVHHQGFATMEELRDHFGVSMNTVRRDAALLVKSGAAEKVYGGLKSSRSSAALVPYEERLSLPDDPEKRAICARAAELVREGDIIFIDSGTTTLHLMDDLQEKNITIITNSMGIILRAQSLPNIRLIVVPGELHRKTHSLTGEDSAAFLSKYNTNWAFMAATGVSAGGGVTNSSPLEYAIKREAVGNTEKAVLMITGKKFGVTSLLTYAHLDNFHAVVTDKSAPPEWVERMENQHLQLISAEAR